MRLGANMNRRRIAKIAACLVLGAATSIAVAWGCVASAGLVSGRAHVDKDWFPLITIAHVPEEPGPPILPDPGKSNVFYNDPRSGLGPYAQWQGCGLTLVRYLGYFGEFPEPIVGVIRELPAWASQDIPRPGSSLGPRAEVVAAGWPLRCCCMAAYGHYSQERHTIAHLGALRVSITNWGDTCGRLPVRPIWSGLMADTALSSAAWAGVLASSGALLRFQRRRRGVCEHCGYDLRRQRDRGCPECGKGCA